MLLAFLLVEFLFTDPANVRGIAALAGGLMPGRIVVAFVQAEMLGFGLCRTRSRHDHGIQRLFQQFGVVDVRTGYNDP